MDVKVSLQHPGNVRFVALLNSSPFSEEERYNIYTIFEVLKDARKVDILDNWQRYLEKLLTVKIHIDEERKTLVHETFQKIVAEIDDAYLRHEEEKKKIQIETKKRQEEMLAAMRYDFEQNRKKIIEMQKKEEKEREEIVEDPLAFMV